MNTVHPSSIKSNLVDLTALPDCTWFEAHPKRTTYLRSVRLADNVPAGCDQRTMAVLKLASDAWLRRSIPPVLMKLARDMWVVKDDCDHGEAFARFVFDLLHENSANGGFVDDETVTQLRRRYQQGVAGGGGGADDADIHDLRNAALGYAARGWQVFPLRPCTDRPKSRFSLPSCCTSDLEVVIDWWRLWPDANIGVATGELSGIIALRVSGENGRCSLQAVSTNTSDALILLEPNGDELHIYEYTPGLANFVNKGDFGGLSMLTDGQFFVAPPSVVRGVA
jgi:hypothetical protein